MNYQFGTVEYSESARGTLPESLFGRLAELAEYVDGDAIDETVDRCPSKVQ